jgi:hypothetical protein
MVAGIVSLLFYLLCTRGTLYYCTAQPFPSQLAELLTCLVKVELELERQRVDDESAKFPIFKMEISNLIFFLAGFFF